MTKRKDTKKRAKDAEPLLSEEERQLFLRAARQGLLPEKKPSLEELDDSSLFEYFVEKKPVEWKREPQAKTKQLKKPCPQKRKKAPYKPYDAFLDLHGLYLDDAVSLLLHFLETARFRGHSQVLVIHGKGSGTLRTSVREVLETHPLVKEFASAPLRLGGEGAVLVRL